MKTISIGLEWGSYPIQELDDNGYIIDDISPEELGLDNNFCNKIQIMQNMYDSLFVNNSKEFSYIGTEKPEEIKIIKEMYVDVINELQIKLNNQYSIIVSELEI